jgi:hypothetical protein
MSHKIINRVAIRINTDGGSVVFNYIIIKIKTHSSDNTPEKYLYCEQLI